jgi:hypothetical protein
MEDKINANNIVKFSIIKFFDVFIKGAAAAFIGIIILFLISSILSKDKSPVIPEGAFKLIRLAIILLVVGGFYSGGAYARDMWKVGEKRGTFIAVFIAIVIGGIYFPFQYFVIDPFLCRALQISFENITFQISMIGAIIGGMFGALLFIVIGYGFKKDEE